MIISFKKSKIKRDDETVAKHEKFDKNLKDWKENLLLYFDAKYECHKIPQNDERAILHL